MTIQHKDIPDSELHETKGAAAASVSQLLVADGLGGSLFYSVLNKYVVALTPTAVATNTTSEQTFTVTGVVLANDAIVSVSKPTHQAGLGIVNSRVSADNTVAITFMNTSAASITPTAESYTIITYKV
jgi:hypothetical protein